MVRRNIVEIDEKKCNGCGQCIPNCAEGALQIINEKARIVEDSHCDGLGACLGHCPQSATTIIEREAPEFDEAAVHQHLTRRDEAEPQVSWCPASQMQVLIQEPEEPEVNAPERFTLRQWPVQLNLVPIKAPFFRDADLLLMADCTAVAYPGLHRVLLKGKTVAIGCPKFDDVNHYIEKLTEILRRNEVRSLIVAHMEVPCCSALNVIAQRALSASGKMIPSQRLVITVEGGISKV
ncbi:4Fe-4S ferredoxin [Candidatus Bathyarchaeota archaeon]|nr:4Fe-4S ferredoxin [Candidatus Bathyarchaeota archaeon]